MIVTHPNGLLVTSSIRVQVVFVPRRFADVLQTWWPIILPESNVKLATKGYMSTLLLTPLNLYHAPVTHDFLPCINSYCCYHWLA